MQNDRLTMVAKILVLLRESGQPCDVTFYDRKPAINVRIDKASVIKRANGRAQLKNSRIVLSNGDAVRLKDIWTVNPMPPSGIPDAEWAEVDMSRGEQPILPSGETMRHVISNTYHCETREEEDYFLRRFLAS